MVQAIVSTGTEEDWLDSDLGLGPIDTAMSVALPEFDGRLISVPISFKEDASADGSGGLAGRLQRYVPSDDRVELVARLAIKQANLALKPNSEKKIAVILSNYPTKDARIGNAVGLDTPNSAVLVLNALKDAGYKVTDIPETGDELVHRIIERCSNDRDSLTEEQLRLAAGHARHEACRRAVVREHAGHEAHQTRRSRFDIPVFRQPPAQLDAGIVLRLTVLLQEHRHVRADRNHRHILWQKFAKLVQHAIYVAIDPHVVGVDCPQRQIVLRHIDLPFAAAQPSDPVDSAIFGGRANSSKRAAMRSGSSPSWT